MAEPRRPRNTNSAPERGWRPSVGVEVFVGVEPIDLRWGFDRLAGLVSERRLAAWIEHYNERRAHMGIDGLCPADRFFGRAERVRAEIEARIRHRAVAASGALPADAPVEENGAGAPVDVLRIAIVDGVAELRVFGARIPLGQVAT